MKKMKKIMAAAIAMMTFSTAAAVTGTVAWFTANNIVSATGMSIKAQAEEGIVIAQELDSYSDASWKTDVEAAHNGATADSKGYIPTSTSNAANWYHANSDSADNHTANTDGVQEVTGITVTDGIGSATVKGIANRHLYLLNHFYVQSTVPTTGILNQDLQIKYVKATDSSEDAKAIALNKSLRVLFKLNSTVQIYAPLEGSDGTTIAAVNQAGAAKKVNGDDATPVKLLTNSTIPAYTPNSNSSALDIEVYCYFEGEDTNCKSANIGTFASISISFKLENVQAA